ncbi:MAG: hypothetical protein QOJ56_4078 [Mycobacterium sp.]|nr:hypothetical protein [Mycobacterium sp.]
MLTAPDKTFRSAIKNADEKLATIVEFLPIARRAIGQIEEFERLLRDDEEFRNLWNTDSAAALRQVGIDPDARVEMGRGPYPDKDACCVTWYARVLAICFGVLRDVTVLGRRNGGKGVDARPHHGLRRTAEFFAR